MKNFILFLFVIVLAIIPLYLQKDAEFSGADGQAEELIEEIAPAYEPWFSTIWEPPSGEIESLLFSLQAAAGAIVIGYVIGFGRARKKYSSK
ncbi:energy-coupling factor ABC transporter substrate-binding protein [Bacillus sp. CMF21]|uniref:energy-coupling factor ABC transporter substrate-binding protein n=1 Tax=Metabacillus dongyingensis TaxID=2874282 RepID=UPI001CC08868|nr:energy-coupling factor ABC transporter substrate-binding protein [Metabacillus dongyingensis]UAL50330.1 energy-coupling factor ABC transporter substrate-binding protein [Metabacillus dongyingensis]UOK56436.1 energy-coupling factor ABC transporter substrate-binding protein [Bacillus sp. OVS6]USK26582.1 energy-coupling factor ABC transporter substrate-binding protein [Bacillus sp. CMF21]